MSFLKNNCFGSARSGYVVGSEEPGRVKAEAAEQGLLASARSLEGSSKDYKKNTQYG